MSWSIFLYQTYVLVYFFVSDLCLGLFYCIRLMSWSFFCVQWFWVRGVNSFVDICGIVDLHCLNFLFINMVEMERNAWFINISC